MRKSLNLIGEKSGKLTVISFCEIRKNGTYWNCVCDCGNKTKVSTHNLTHLKTKSCGCSKSEFLKKSKTKHNMCKSSEYEIWVGIKKRCCNEKSPSYKNYGGRGIKICDEWSESFENFYKDMGDRPSDKHEIDRIDNDGNYCKENCRWVTRSVNSQNQRKQKGKSSNYRGVRKEKNRWEVGIMKNGKRYYLGRFVLEKEAAEAYNKKAIELYGENAYLNKFDEED